MIPPILTSLRVRGTLRSGPLPEHTGLKLTVWLLVVLAISLTLASCAAPACDPQAAQDYWELTAPEHAHYIRSDATLAASEKTTHLTTLRLRGVEIELAGATLDPDAKRAVFAPVPADPADPGGSEGDAESDDTNG